MYIGNNEINAVYLGSEEISKIYQGNTVIYEKGGDVDYTTMPLTFEITGDGDIYWKTSNISVTKTIEYKLNDGEWTSITSNTGSSAPSISVVSGDTLQFRGDNSQYGTLTTKYSSFSGSTAQFKVKGNIMSLIDSTNFSTLTTLSSNYTFNYLFYNCTSLTDASNLILPATTLANSCYREMFYGCTSLTTAPSLPATTLAQSCYSSMFHNCTSLTTAPELPATTLASMCYNQMFAGTNVLPDCSNIDFTSETVVASNGLRGLFAGTKVTDNDLRQILPINPNTNNYYLPVTALASYCYSQMFYGCTSLTTAPQLPATTLADSCYAYMFQGCTSLTTAPQLPATTLANYCYMNMFQGCTSLTTAPQLPVTILTDGCYKEMFNGCTNLTTAPELPATTLIKECYYQMFRGCTSLNYIKCLATDISASQCTKNWVYNVASSGTFVTPSSTAWSTGSGGIPTNWTRVDA